MRGSARVRLGSAIPLGLVRPVNDGRRERLGQLRRDWFSKWRDEFGEYSRAAPVGQVRGDAGWVRRIHSGKSASPSGEQRREGEREKRVLKKQEGFLKRGVFSFQV